VPHPSFTPPVSIFYILEQDSDVLMSGKSWRNSKKKKKAASWENKESRKVEERKVNG